MISTVCFIRITAQLVASFRSAGVGRTGTFIVIDHVLEQIEKEKVVDIPGAITEIRQRLSLIHI